MIMQYFFKIQTTTGSTVLFDIRNVESIEWIPSTDGKTANLNLILKSGDSYALPSDQLETLWQGWRAAADPSLSASADASLTQENLSLPTTRVPDGAIDQS
jgi:hypothetical protein